MADATSSEPSSSPAVAAAASSGDIDPNTLWHSPFAKTADGSKLLSTVRMMNNDTGKIGDFDSGRVLSKESEEAMKLLNRLAEVSIPDAAPMLLRVQKDLKKRCAYTLY